MKSVELKFHIHAFSRDTIPMSRLAEYLLDLSAILGEKHSVHFDRLEDGSAVPVLKIDAEAEPKVRHNAFRARTGDAPADVRRAKERLEQRLNADNAKGAEVVDPTSGFKLLEFRGRTVAQQEWGPVRQAGELTGRVYSLGGKNETVPVKLQDGDRTYACQAKREIARKLKPFLLEERYVRVSGYGKWSRDDQGEWNMEEFTIADFEPLDSAPLADVLSDLRSVKSKWLDGEDPLAELDELKDDE